MLIPRRRYYHYWIYLLCGAKGKRRFNCEKKQNHKRSFAMRYETSRKRWKCLTLYRLIEMFITRDFPAGIFALLFSIIFVKAFWGFSSNFIEFSAAQIKWVSREEFFLHDVTQRFELTFQRRLNGSSLQIIVLWFSFIISLSHSIIVSGNARKASLFRGEVERMWGEIERTRHDFSGEDFLSNVNHEISTHFSRRLNIWYSLIR